MRAAHVHRVLVVDDDRDGLDALVFYLRAAGVDSVGALGGAMALQELRNGLGPCVVLTDIRMAPLNGWQLVEAVKADAGLCTIPVMIVSGSDEDAARALRLGACAYFRKPAMPDEILHAIGRHCPASKVS